MKVEKGAALSRIEADPTLGAIVFTGSNKALAAGAYGNEKAKNSFTVAFQANLGGPDWQRLAH